MDTDWFFLSKQYVTMQYKHGKMFYSLKSYILQCDICMFYNMILPRMTVACGINFIAELQILGNILVQMAEIVI